MNARRILLELFDAALRAVDGRACVARFLAPPSRAGRCRRVRGRQGRERHGARRARRRSATASIATLVITKDGHVDPELDASAAR